MRVRLGAGLLICCLMAPAGLLSAGEEQELNVGNQKAKTFTQDGEEVFSYLLYLPKKSDQQEKLPLLLFLHGAGERGDDLAVVAKHGPPRQIKEGKDLPFIVVSPQCPRNTFWRTEDVVALLDSLVKELKVDEDRIYVTGLSMGGFGSWALAAEIPDRLAAVVPICGGGDPEKAENMKDLPIWVFHGAKDNAVPLKRSQDMVDALKDAGSKVKFTIYPEAGHDSWTESYNNPELYEWLLKQKRSGKKSEE